MRSLSLLLAALAASTATAELTFVATAQQNGKDVDASGLQFVPIPPQRHRQFAPLGSLLGGIGSSSSSKKTTRETISYSSNWCGASQHGTQADGIANVYGDFTAPDLTLRSGQSAPQFASAWIGLDGAECNTTLLQTGITTVVNSNGGQSSNAWWQWYPDSSYTISGFDVKPSDWIQVNITTTSATSATLVITNVSQGYSVTMALSNGPKLCRLDAEWILEDFYDQGSQVTLANFSDLWFIQSGATTVSGKAVGLNGAAMIKIQDENGNILCSAEPYDNSDFVMVSHA